MYLSPESAYGALYFPPPSNFTSLPIVSSGNIITYSFTTTVSGDYSPSLLCTALNSNTTYFPFTALPRMYLI